MQMRSRLRWGIGAVLMAMSLHGAVAHAATDTDQAATLWRLLDYVAVDYREAVDEQGAIISDGEYAEMREFSRTVAERLETLPERPETPALRDQAADLVAAIEGRAQPSAVARDARTLAAVLITAYPMPLAPASPPDLKRGETLYRQECAGCHGVGGAGDGPQAARMEPPPIAFTDADRAAERSAFALYQVTTQGLDGTAMASFAQLPVGDRWALAFYVGSLAYSTEQRSEGAKLWSQGVGRDELADLKSLSATAPAALAATHGAERAAALMAFLRTQPSTVVAGSGEMLSLARMRLAESRAAYARGDAAAAAELALSAYLDGFEPVEPLLATRDSALLVRIESAMTEFRVRIGRRVSASEVDDQAAAVGALFDQAESTLSDDSTGAVSAFLGALTILLREGLEALLIVVAIVAFLRKADRSDALFYVHAGWIGALAAGVATWGAATYLVSISGAGRELTEGVAALFAAIVLLFVGIWMHGKSQAGVWQQYVKQRMSHALSKRSAWFLALLAFVVVYREVFETILFYAAMWTQGAHRAILAGAALAALLLVGIAWAMLRYSRRLPITQFFAASAALIAVLTVVLAGKGIAALQEAGVLSVDTLAGPRIDWLGVYPTWEGLVTQLAVLLVLVAGFAWNRHVGRLSLTRGA